MLSFLWGGDAATEPWADSGRDGAKADRVRGAVKPSVVRALDVSALRASGFKGRLVWASSDDDEYHALRASAFSFSAAGYPACVTLPTDAQDVVVLVKALREPAQNGDVVVAVSAGKHSFLCMLDDAVNIDLQRLSGAVPDLDKRVVHVLGGTKIQVVDAALAGTGFGFVTGTNGDTGVEGLTFAGGLGFLARLHGPACDSIVEAEVVLETGELVVCRDDNEHAMLMRALRGGGGNFGVVTRLTMELVPVSACMGGEVIRLTPTWASARTLASHHNAFCKTAPPNLALGIIFPCGVPVTVSMCVAVNAPSSARTYADVPELQQVYDLPGAWLRFNKMKPLDYHTQVQCLVAEHQKQLWRDSVKCRTECYNEPQTVTSQPFPPPSLASTPANLSTSSIALLRSYSPT